MAGKLDILLSSDIKIYIASYNFSGTQRYQYERGEVTLKIRFIFGIERKSTKNCFEYAKSTTEEIKLVAHDIHDMRVAFYLD